MTDIFNREFLGQLRQFLLEVSIEGTTRAMHAALAAEGDTPADPIKVVLPPDISTTPPPAPTDASLPPVPAPPAPSAPPASTAPAAGAVADIPMALAPSDIRYFQRSLWCDMRVRSNADEADKAVEEFNQRWK